MLKLNLIWNKKVQYYDRALLVQSSIDKETFWVRIQINKPENKTPDCAIVRIHENDTPEILFRTATGEEGGKYRSRNALQVAVQNYCLYNKLVPVRWSLT